MRTIALFTATAAAVSGVVASPLDLNLPGLLGGFDLSFGNGYGSPFPPWKGGNPGWYYGHHPELYPNIPCLTGTLCEILKYFPGILHCPPKPPKPTKPVSTSHTATPTSTSPPTPTPTDGYVPTFSNITAATQADDFMTFGLVDTEEDCLTMCNSVAGCEFVNAYHDVNGKGGSTQLTCSLFKLCHTSADADNRGGQSQPNGSVDFIIDSDGFCKQGGTFVGSS